MISVATPENRQVTVAEAWEAIPFEQRVEIDMALGQGNKPEAAKRCVCANTGFTLLTAKNFVERRATELAKRNISKPN